MRIECMNEDFFSIYCFALAQEKLKDKNVQNLQATSHFLKWRASKSAIVKLTDGRSDSRDSLRLSLIVLPFSLLSLSYFLLYFFCRTSPFFMHRKCAPLSHVNSMRTVYNFFIFVYTYYLVHSRYLISVVKWNEWNLRKGRQTAGSDRTIHSVSHIFSVESLFPLALPLLSDICVVLLTSNCFPIHYLISSSHLPLEVCSLGLIISLWQLTWIHSDSTWQNWN